MIHAYIDESGDEGITERSSPWLLLGALVIHQSEIAGAKAFLTDGVGKVWKGRKAPAHVHFNKIQDHAQRKAILKMLSGLNFTASIVAVRKSQLEDRTLNRLRSPKLYNYVAKHLLERLSWLAQDRCQKIHITFATRSESSWTAFKEYVDLLRTRTDHQIKFEHIHSLRNVPINQDIVLQAADWMTSGCGCGLNPDGFGETECIYTEILWGKFWVRKGKLWPYGFKILPSDHDRRKEKLLRKIDAWLEDPTTII